MKRIFLLICLILVVSLMAYDPFAETEPNNTSGNADIIPNTGVPIWNGTGTITDEFDMDWGVFEAVPGDNFDLTISLGTVTVAVYTSSNLTTPVATAIHSGPANVNFNIVDGNGFFKITSPTSTSWGIQLVNNTNNTLPVELSSFSASVTTNNFVALNWVSASEQNLVGYMVHRSEDESLSQAQILTTTPIAATNSSTETSYDFTDVEVENGKSYNYWLQSLELDGTSEYFGPVNISIEESGNQNEETPPAAIVTGFKGCFPNPFNPQTSFAYSLEEDSPVVFEIFNLKGQKVKTIDAGIKTEGEHKDVYWYGKDDNNKPVASGIYFVKMKSRKFTKISKTILLK